MFLLTYCNKIKIMNYYEAYISKCMYLELVELHSRLTKFTVQYVVSLEFTVNYLSFLISQPYKCCHCTVK